MLKSWLSRCAPLAVLLAALSLPLAALAAPPVAGVDYVEIPAGEPFGTAPGQIEVVEVFGYTCPHCAHFEPMLQAWKADLPDDVDLVRVPAPFGGYWIPYARAYYAAESLELLPRTHEATFRALHEERSLPIANATPAEISGFYAGFGADPEQFRAAMASAETDAALGRAMEFIRRSGVDGTPSLVVAGKYKVIANSFEDLLRIADALIERERAGGDSDTVTPAQAGVQGL